MGEIGGQSAGGNSLAALLSWQNLVFTLPLGASVFLLLLSSFRLGGGKGHSQVRSGGYKSHAGGGQGRHHHSGNSGHAKAATGKGHSKPGAKHNNGSSKNHATPLGFIMALVGANRAPLPLIAQIFCLAWGVGGLAAGRLLPGGEGEPSGAGGSSLRFLFCLLAAFAFGFVAARIGAELLARFMPQESTSVVSRDALYGLTGKVIFPVTASAGRVRVYDEWNTLHDESCRKATALEETDDAPIAKGRTVRIVDRDAKGCLIVEEI